MRDQRISNLQNWIAPRSCDVYIENCRLASRIATDICRKPLTLYSRLNHHTQFHLHLFLSIMHIDK